MQAVSWLKSFILGVRRIRAERDIAPGKPLAVRVHGGNASEAEWLQANQAYIKTLARVESIQTVEDIPEDAAMALAGEMTLLVPLADIINPVEELARIDKELQNAEKEIQRLSGKLNNENFVSRAPEAVVAKEREKLADAEDTLAKLQQQKERIQKLLD